MKLTKSLLVVAIACGTVWAQAPASKNPAPAAKNAPPAKNAAPAKTAVVPAAKAVPPQKTPAKPVVVAKKPVPPPVKKAPAPHVATAKPTHAPIARKKAAHPASGEVKPASVKEEATATRVGKMRDPFVSPVVAAPNGHGNVGCETGKRCLVVDQIVLKGIVKSQSGFIAVVENPAKRAYFMRENDPVFNGKVVKITGDTVVFQEEVMDKVGKQSMREVVKKVNAPVV